jgi:hypothetical protein
MTENMPNHKHIPVVTCPQTTDELLDAAKVEFARGLARLAKTDNANPRTLELLERALFNRELIALKRRELDLVRQRLDQESQEFDARNAIRPRRRLLAIQIHEPESK